MVEFFDVRNADEASFREAWADAAPTGAVLYRALREDVQPRYAALADGPATGVLLLTREPIDLVPLHGRQGFITGRRDGDVTIIHWSSPLMVARARVHHSIPGSLYVHATLAGTQPHDN